MKNYAPVDLPNDLDFVYNAFDTDALQKMDELKNKAYAQGKWRSSEDMLFVPAKDNYEFWAYYLQKAKEPITIPMKDSGVREALAPFRQTTFDFTPESFQPDKKVVISLAGDLMNGKYLAHSKDLLYDKVADLLFETDFAFANLESTISPQKPVGFAEAMQAGDTPHINLRPDEYQSLTRHKERTFDLLQLANNHIMDCQEEGFNLNISALKRDHIDFVGIYENESEVNKVKTITIGELTIGWIAHTYSLNLKPTPENKDWAIDVTPFHMVENPDTSRIKRQILAAKEAGCDLVMLSLHWGAEWEFFPQPKQLEWAREFAEWGADAIIGTHPHVIQPIEVYNPQSRPGKSVPILYSLGNLTSIIGAAHAALSLIGNLRIETGLLNGKKQTLITGLQITPVVWITEEQDGQRNAVIMPLADLNQEQLDTQMQQFVRQVNAYADLVIGKDWRTPVKKLKQMV